ncbi:porin family protein [Hoeflea olei]|nr:porin family protein [Hoeflea olei]
MLLGPGGGAAAAETPFQAAEALVSQGHYAEAEALLAGSRFEGSEAIPAAYLLAVVYARTGRPEHAEKLLRDILARQPDIDAVRIELIKMLALQGKRQAAGYHLNRLADTADLERDQDQLAQLSRRIGTTEGFSIAGYFSLAPSTNINDGTGQSTVMIGGLPFVINNASREHSGVGVKAGVVVGYAHSLSENLSAYAALSAGLSDYSNDSFDKQQGELRVGLRRDELRHSLQIEAIADRQWYNRKGQSAGIGGRIATRFNIAPGWWLSGEIVQMYRSYDAGSAANAWTTRATASVRHAVSRRLTLSAGSSYERESVSARPWNSYQSFSGTLGLETPLAYGLRVNATVTAGTRDFKDQFPGLRLVREDRFWELRGRFTKDNFEIAGFSPVVSVFTKRQTSNVAFYDFTSSGMELTFTKAF